MHKNSNTDNLTVTGYIDKSDILDLVTEEQIFELVFGFQPEEFDYVTSPFRHDKKPGCWFERSLSGELRFKDFGNFQVRNRITMKNISCFDAVQVYYKLPNFYQTLSFIRKHLIDGKELKKVEKKEYEKSAPKPGVEINISTRDFTLSDKKVWEVYSISKQNLIDDMVFPINRFKLLNTKKGDISIKVNDPSYAFTEFSNGKKKIYRPLQEGKRRFITNCTQNDIGGLKNLFPSGRQLIIQKSYKDSRILKNQGLNCIWNQNEGMIPHPDILIPICRRFDKVIVFYDNDRAGITASNDLMNMINHHLPGKAKSFYIPPKYPYITDPGDLVKHMGIHELKSLLKQYKILL